MKRIAITGATAIPMDGVRRVLHDTTILIEDDRIAALGNGIDIPGDAKRIDADHMIAVPGLIDSHAHSGHALTRNIGAGDGAAWFAACEATYTRGSTPGFWRAEARLAALERLKAGITTCTTLLGGGRDNFRTDTTEAGDIHCGVTREVGLRTFLAVGPNRTPFPKRYLGLDLETELTLDFDTQISVCRALYETHHDPLGHGTGISLIMPVYQPDEYAADPETVREMCGTVMALRAELDAPFTQDGHRTGSIELGADLGLLGPASYLSHSVDLTEADMEAALETGTTIVHNPSAIMSIFGRCPVPELRALGVNVALGSDAAAPDRGYDMFRHMSQCLHYHRRHFRDTSVLGPWDVLEMCTIDAARALRLDRDLGSLEVGKKADIVLVDRRAPHLVPEIMPVTALAHFANAGDVDTVIVDGQVLMRARKTSVDELGVLDDANDQIGRAVERCDLAHLLEE